MASGRPAESDEAIRAALGTSPAAAVVAMLGERAAATAVPNRTADALHVVYIEQGEMRLRSDGEDMWIGTASLAIGTDLVSAAPPADGVAGWWLALDRRAFTGAPMMVSSPFAAIVTSLALAPRPVVVASVPAVDRDWWTLILRTIADELGHPRPDRDSAVEALTGMVMRRAAHVAFPPTRGGAPAMAAIVTAALAFIDEHYAAPIGLAEVAAGLARSRSSVARAVRTGTGRSVAQLIVDRRMHEARRLLRESPSAIEQVACAVGYADPSYFTRRFQLEHGEPPREWRRRHA